MSFRGKMNMNGRSEHKWDRSCSCCTSKQRRRRSLKIAKLKAKRLWKRTWRDEE